MGLGATRIILLAGGMAMASACATLPEPKVPRFAFPKGAAYVGDVKRPYKKLGLVKTKVNFNSLDATHEEDSLCRNFYNKGAADLVKRAKKHGGDAVIDLRSVVFYEGGAAETFQTPECSDEGAEGQILMQGIAVKWGRAIARTPEEAEFRPIEEDKGRSMLVPVPDKMPAPRSRTTRAPTSTAAAQAPAPKTLRALEEEDEDELPADNRMGPLNEEEGPTRSAPSPLSPFAVPTSRKK